MKSGSYEPYDPDARKAEPRTYPPKRIGAAHPFFRSKLTGRAISVKHTLRGSERDLLDAPRADAAKVIYPFAISDLSLGGAAARSEMKW